ncbi:MAG TPA: isoaspartyl peptidase/L-asparaginase [Kofleriaceae bacterium]|nr:isoaspartyl peptidase/L-asparaginase [Kofleriaceae bacterium]
MIVVHGGAGPIAPDRKDRLLAGVRAAAAAGEALLQRGAAALDAVVAAVRMLEDDPEFGAGVGSALTRDGTVETCASVMDGATRRAGGIVAAPDLAAPVIVARALLERGEHAVLAGHAAMAFASEIGMQPAPRGTLITPRTQAAWAEVRAGAPKTDGGGVGAVAMDRNGGFAAATSAGGTVFRRPGAVDDSSVPGIGTWADAKCAVSTSCGDAAFRVALAHEIAARINDGANARAAAKDALKALRSLSADSVAGVIIIDARSWTALHLGPAMPYAWHDKAGPGSSDNAAL